MIRSHLKRFMANILIAGSLFFHLSFAYAGDPSVDVADIKFQVNTNPPCIPKYTYQIMQAFPHDTNAYTQGLAFYDGVLYEGTGIRGRSSLRRVELETGLIIDILKLPDHIFGEGIVVYDDKIVQLTWDSNVGYVFEKDNFDLLQEFSYPTEGWGITYGDQRLMMSDGSAAIHFLNAETFLKIGQIQVHDDHGPIDKLNELEYINGEIYANIWMSDKIARIHPGTGKVVGWIDLKGILQHKGPAKPVDVLNGIAYDSINDRLFVTGKLWPWLFEIKLIKLQQDRRSKD